MPKKNGLLTQLRKLKLGYVNGQVFDYPLSSIQARISEARRLVDSGEWGKWKFSYDKEFGDANEPLIYIYKERKRK